MNDAAELGRDARLCTWFKRSRFVVAIVTGALATVCILGSVWWKYSFPYGPSHSCSAGVGSSLRMYAEVSDGWFPHGLNTPEASLSLLRTNDRTAMKWFIKGKHLSQSVVDRAMSTDGFLSRASCGWHYVEGLRDNDDDRLAIAWDRVEGLDHKGRRRPGLMREVVMKNGSHPYVMRKGWAEFAKLQSNLLAETIAKRPPKSPLIRWSDEETLGPNKFPPPTNSLTK